MSLPKSIESYADIQEVLEKLLSLEGEFFTFECENERSAVHLLSRINMLRKLIREKEGFCSYDTLSFKREGQKVNVQSTPFRNFKLKDAKGEEISLQGEEE